MVRFPLARGSSETHTNEHPLLNSRTLDPQPFYPNIHQLAPCQGLLLVVFWLSFFVGVCQAWFPYDHFRSECFSLLCVLRSLLSHH
jgi:hypothetical protein